MYRLPLALSKNTLTVCSGLSLIIITRLKSLLNTDVYFVCVCAMGAFNVGAIACVYIWISFGTLRISYVYMHVGRAGGDSLSEHRRNFTEINGRTVMPICYY